MEIEIEVSQHETFLDKTDTPKGSAGPEQVLGPMVVSNTAPETFKGYITDDSFFERKDPNSIPVRLQEMEEKLETFYDLFGDRADNTSFKILQRFGMDVVEKGLLTQYIDYLKGLHEEIRGDNFPKASFLKARDHYVEALKNSQPVYHRVRRSVLQRMLVINKCLGVSINPEKVLLSSYFLRRKDV